MEVADQLQVHLITKDPKYSIADIPYSLSAKVSELELNTLLNELLRESSAIDENIVFDFFIAGECFRTTLEVHCKKRLQSFEDVIEIEYAERFPEPVPQDCLLHDDWVSTVESKDKWILSGSYDNTINLWTTKGTHVLTIPGHLAPVKAVTWISLDAEKGVFASASQDQTSMIWEWNIGKNSVECIHVCKGHERGVECIAISPSTNLMATGSWDTMLKIWSPTTDGSNQNEIPSKKAKTDSNTKTPNMTLTGHREAISGVKWMSEDTLVTSSWDHTIKIWDLTMQGIKSEIFGQKTFFDVSYSHLNGLLVAATVDRNIRLYDPRSLQGTIVKSEFNGHTQWIQSVCWSTTDEHLFISASYDQLVKLWDTRSTNVPIYDLKGHEDKIHACNWSNPKYIVSGGADNTVRVFKSGLWNNNSE